MLQKKPRPKPKGSAAEPVAEKPAPVRKRVMRVKLKEQEAQRKADEATRIANETKRRADRTSAEDKAQDQAETLASIIAEAVNGDTTRLEEGRALAGMQPDGSFKSPPNGMLMKTLANVRLMKIVDPKTLTNIPELLALLDTEVVAEKAPTGVKRRVVKKSVGPDAPVSHTRDDVYKRSDKVSNLRSVVARDNADIANARAKGKATLADDLYEQYGDTRNDLPAAEKELKAYTKENAEAMANAGFTANEVATMAKGDPLPSRTRQSVGQKEAGTNKDAVTTKLKKLFFNPDNFGKLVTVVQSIEDVPSEYRADLPATTRGFIAEGKAYLIADNIPAGSELAVMLHELGAHIGMPKLLGAVELCPLSQAPI